MQFPIDWGKEDSMDIREGKLTAKDGLSIYWKAWVPDGKPKAVIHLIHGYAEHASRYANVVNELVPAGYAVFGTDHRGHGRSDGRRGHVESFQDYIDDEKQFAVEVIKPAFPDAPYVLVGHSMGSLITLNYAEQFPGGIKAIVLSGTGSLPGKGVPRFIITLTKVLANILPRIHVKSPLPPEFISRDPEVVRAYVNDPLVYNVIPPRLANEMNKYLATGGQNAWRITKPVLILHGSEDTAFSGQKELLETIGSPDKTLKIYDGLRHEVYNELPADRARVLADLRTWLDAHV
jgi:alpha-beta hydrolase superfamily lysophospholipase